MARCNSESGANGVVTLESLEKKNQEKSRKCLLKHECSVRILEYL